MEKTRAQVIGDWLFANRAELTQDVLLKDMRAVIGWAPHRPNLSKYEHGKGAGPKPETLAKFIDYWARKGKAGPDFSPAPTVEPPANDLAALVVELREWRTKDRDRIAGLETLVGSLSAQLQRAREQLEQLERRVPRATGE